MNQADKNWLTEQLGADVLFDEPMRLHTTFRIGGPVDALVTVRTEKQIRTIVHWARQTGQRIMVFGAGSNLLVRDGGVRGVMIRLAGDFDRIRSLSDEHEETVTVEAGAGVQVHRLSRYALECGLAGLNFAVGMPGTVGGALRMNAGAWGGSMADLTSRIRVLSADGGLSILEGEQIRFAYRRLALEREAIILSGRFTLRRGDSEALEHEALRMQMNRKLSQPLSVPSAGSIFRNPKGEKTAGQLIDQAGLKGARLGGAEVSTKHANFIINKGHAKASEVLGLIHRIRKRVFEKYGIDLETEVKIVGEEAHS